MAAWGEAPGGLFSCPGTLGRMGWLTAVLLVYGLLNIGLGLEAFLAKGSTISLVAAGTAGLLVIGFAALAKSYPKPGYIGAAVVAILLIGRFMGPLMAKKQIYPAGVMVVASVAVLVCLAVGHFMARKG